MFSTPNVLKGSVCSIRALRIAVLLVLLASPKPGLSQVTFGSPAEYAVGTTPGAVACGDFNNDGRLDLAVADAVEDKISILLGDGDGTLQPPVGYPVGRKPMFILEVDLNLDDHVDLAVAFQGDTNSQQPGGISLLLGNGDGSFKPATNIPTNSYPNYLATGDFNGDSKADLVMPSNDQTVSVFTGNGDGSFKAPVQYGVNGSVTSVAVGDFNGDGKTDVAIGTVIHLGEQYNGNVSVLLGTGDGTFEPPIESDGGTEVYGLTLGDFNGDGKLDVAFLTKANVYSIPRVVVSFGRGDGTFGVGGGVVDSNFDSFLIPADLNQDGSSDLVALSFPVVPAARVFLVADDNSFGLDQTVVFSDFGPVAAAVGDLNNDHLPDLAISMGSLRVVNILLNTTVDFALDASALDPGTVYPGQSATATLSASAANGFSGTVSFTCAVLPAPAEAPQCSVSPGAVDTGTLATLTITTTGPHAAWNLPHGRSGLFYALWLPLFASTLVIHGIGRPEKSLLTMLFFLAAFGGLLVLSSCGGSSIIKDGPHHDAGTPAGGYTITITASSGTQQHITKISLTVH